MSLGSLWLKLRTKYGKGLRVAFARDYVRPKILETEPVISDTTGPVELHVLTSKGDWLNLFWSLKSFYYYADRKYPICIHEDGSLPDEARVAIRKHFPTARFMERPIADEQIKDELEKYPNCKAFREKHPLALKVFDFSFFLNAERMFLFDSDLIFYSKPEVLIQRLEDPDYRMNSVNGDIFTAYNTSPEEIRERYGFELIERFNSGLGVLHKESLAWEDFEDYLNLPNIFAHHWRTEQTLLAIASCRFGAELLPDEYTVYRGNRNLSFPVRHYVGEIRHLMYKEGMLELNKRGILKNPAM